jgi:SAM-dependent methyltransferase
MIQHIFFSVIKPPYIRMRRFLTYLLFERRYGVTTDESAGRVDLDDENKERNQYRATALTSLRRILRRNEVGPDDVFIDLGSGMGRVVLQAALGYPFRHVIGVELSHQLHEIAQANVERNRDRLTSRNVTLINSDVLDYQIPDDVTIAFLYNPFVGDTFRTVVDRLIASVDRNPRSLRIIYGNPVEEEALLATGRVAPIRTLRGWRPTQEWSISNSFRMYRILPADVAGPRHASSGQP